MNRLMGAMVFVVAAAFACTEDGSDEPPPDASAAGGANDEFADDAGAGGDAAEEWAPSEAVHDACVRFCELETMLLPTCVPGRDVIRNGVWLGSGGAPPEIPPPPECVRDCREGLRGAPLECETGYLRSLSCATDTTWTCVESLSPDGETAWVGEEDSECSQTYSDLTDCLEQ